jgi:molecular chaperone Hsp33
MSFGGELAVEARDESWRRAVIMMGSSTSKELTDPDLGPNDLLYRLFHEIGVRVFPPHTLRAECRCTRARVEYILRSLPRDEIATMKIDDRVVVTCEFCNKSESFDDADLDALYSRA